MRPGPAEAAAAAAAAAATPAKARAAKAPEAPEARPGRAAPAHAAPSKASAASAAAVTVAATPGKPGLVLEGVTMCFTGEMEMLTRPDAEEKAKAAGAKVTAAVSGNTKYLVLGSRLDDGRAIEETSKYRKYAELKEKGKKHPELLTEAQFMALLPESKESVASAAAPAPAPAPIASSGGAAAIASGGAGGEGSAAAHSNWVDSHAPRGFGELIGNASIVRKLTEWLRDWDSVVLKGQSKKAPFKPGGGMPENVNARAALVSGPPGIGKTTACRLVAQMHGGYEVLEFNASDSRGMKVIQEMAAGIADNKTISFSGGLGHNKVPGFTRRAVIIMDEVDGMGAGDRGGNAALIKMIKKTRNPIICICNDAHSQKVRSLAFSCYDLKFTRPAKGIIAQRVVQIAKEEGLEVEPNAVEALAESCGSDMRMVVNQLQMLARSPMYQQVGVKYMDVKNKIHDMSKDQGIMLSPFDACKKLLNSFEGARMSFRDRMDMFFVDHSLMGLLVHENYLKSVDKKPVTDDLLSRCAYSADLMTLGDMINARIRDAQDWSLLPDLGVMSAVFPAYLTNGFLAFPGFPAFLGKYSTQTRMRRLATELQTHLRLTTTVSHRALCTSGYTELLYKRLLDPLMANTEAVSETVDILDAYGLRKEHVVEHLTELRQHIGGDDLFKLIDPKVKAAMTRELNSGGHAVKVVIPSAGKKRKLGAAEEANPDEIDDDAEHDKEPEGGDPGDASDEGEPAGGLLKIKGGAKAKAKGKAKAKAKAAEETPAVRAPKATGKAKAKGKART